MGPSFARLYYKDEKCNTTTPVLLSFGLYFFSSCEFYDEDKFIVDFILFYVILVNPH